MTLKPCTDPTCSHRQSEITKTYIPYPQWLRGPDPIVEHCKCGQHNRVWSTDALLRVWQDRPK